MIEKIVELIRRFAPMSSRTWDLDFLLAGPDTDNRFDCDAPCRPPITASYAKGSSLDKTVGRNSATVG
jgi:hypothetical protein